MNDKTTYAADAVPPGPVDAHDVGDTDESLDLMTRWFGEFGDTYRVFSPARNSWTWVIHDPDDVKRVLVTNHRNYTKGIGIDRVRLLLGNGIMTSEGTFWRKQRRMMQPSFHRRVVEKSAGIIRNANETLLARWDAAAMRGESINLTESMSEFTLDAVLQAIFGKDHREFGSGAADNPFMLVARETRRDPRFAYEFRQLSRLVAALVERRRASSTNEHFDYVQMLIAARDPDSGEGMSDRALVDEILTLVIAGHETTASALNWAWWLIAQHPDVEARVHEEQDRTGDLGLADHAALQQLPYTAQVLQESMRLYPPGWLLSRRTVAADRLGGYHVPENTDVLLGPYFVHRHPRHWQRPDAFDPAHFEVGRVDARHQFAYIPFGAGPRHCIGENLANYEMMLHMNLAVRRFRLRPVDDRPVALEARVNLRPAQDIRMQVERR